MMADDTNPGDDLTSLRLRIEGVVQAVGYRNHVVTEARKLGLDGWVRNRSDRSVEVLVSGATASVQALVGVCMRGPPGARVTNIDLHAAEAPAERGFHWRQTV
jgi:acylphosphatase